MCKIIGIVSQFTKDYLILKEIVLDSIFGEDEEGVLSICCEQGIRTVLNDGTRIVKIGANRLCEDVCGYRFNTIYVLPNCGLTPDEITRAVHHRCENPYKDIIFL